MVKCLVGRLLYYYQFIERNVIFVIALQQYSFIQTQHHQI